MPMRPRHHLHGELGGDRDGCLHRARAGTPRGGAEANAVGCVAHPRDEIQASFGTLSNLNEPADRQASSNGYLTIYFFSFADLAKKKAFYEAQELGESGDFA